jgi:hypothetical protein
VTFANTTDRTLVEWWNAGRGNYAFGPIEEELIRRGYPTRSRGFTRRLETHSGRKARIFEEGARLSADVLWTGDERRRWRRFLRYANDPARPDDVVPVT